MLPYYLSGIVHSAGTLYHSKQPPYANRIFIAQAAKYYPYPCNKKYLGLWYLISSAFQRHQFVKTFKNNTLLVHNADKGQALTNFIFVYLYAANN